MSAMCFSNGRTDVAEVRDSLEGFEELGEDMSTQQAVIPLVELIPRL